MPEAASLPARFGRTLRRRLYGAMTEWRTRRHVAAVPRRIAACGEVTLVYQMGRVASQTLNDALVMAGTDPVYHVHWLSRKRLTDACERSRRHHGRVRPRHLRVALALRQILDGGGLERFRWRIVTVVRDPMARNLSDYFLALGDYCLPGFFERYRRGEASAEEALRDFLEGYDHGCRDRWFDEEIRSVFGIDVLAEPFDPGRGYAVVERGNVSVLVLRQESLADTLAPALREWLGVSLPAVPARHVSGTDPNGDVYRAMLARARFPREFVERMYTIPWVRHFYAEHEIEAFIRRWVG